MRASVALSMETVLWILFSSTVTISIVADNILNGLRVFGSNFVNGAFAMPPDSVICGHVLSRITCCTV